MPYSLLLCGWHSQGNFGVSSLPLLLPQKLSSGSTLPATPSTSCLPAPSASDSWWFCTILCILGIFPCAQGVHTTPGTAGGSVPSCAFWASFHVPRGCIQLQAPLASHHTSLFTARKINNLRTTDEEHVYTPAQLCLTL